MYFSQIKVVSIYIHKAKVDFIKLFFPFTPTPLYKKGKIFDIYLTDTHTQIGKLVAVPGISNLFIRRIYFCISFIYALLRNLKKKYFDIHDEMKLRYEYIFSIYSPFLIFII